ncbi:uncharacterized protein LOC118511452 [Anopheles stephensi]|uniref:uncharacterized protein LOC118511452 n=1 Tax=Anopheles stephensi TaxID=30069 RepID=UPI0016588497|nr:uncharacterized protein LOC118511452 [Anopheles stephensi]
MCRKRLLILVLLTLSSASLAAEYNSTTVEPRRHSSPYPYAWRWWIAHSILWIITGGFWLTVFIIVVLFKAFPAKHSCHSPIILEEPPVFDHHHDLHSSTGWAARQANLGASPADWQLYWKDRLEAKIENLR